jgi:hypothetical protein
MSATGAARWLLLIHQIPPRPAYLRVKVGRRLHSLGAVAVKNSVYVLPRSDDTLEDFQWVRREIVAGGGEASVCEAHFVEGLSDDSVEALFRAAREADYEALASEARRLQVSLKRSRRPTRRTRERASAGLLRLRRRLDELARIDLFGAGGRGTVEGILASLERSLRPEEVEATGPGREALGRLRGRRWVTRAGVHVDRMASAWLIRRFIDPEARFGFVRAGTPAAEGELRFDMFEAEFTHEGEQCTFEVLLRRFALDDAALRQIGEIVHDVDLKDARFARPEATGLDRLIAGIALRHVNDDAARLRDGGEVFEALYEYFHRKKR